MLLTRIGMRGIDPFDAVMMDKIDGANVAYGAGRKANEVR